MTGASAVGQAESTTESVAVHSIETTHALLVRGLTVRYGARPPVVTAIDIDVSAGEVVALLGESGSGKSSIVNALLGLLPDGAQVTTDDFVVGGTRVNLAHRRRMRDIRGRTVGLVPQDCAVALDPVLRVGPQILEGIPGVARMPRRERMQRVAELLRKVGFGEPETLARKYPHELSGGMAQRVMIAVALAAAPALLIADEPSAALDTLAQAQAMDWITELARQDGIGVLMVTHDLSLAAQRADRGLLLAQGTIVARGDIHAVAPTLPHPLRRLTPRPSVDATNNDHAGTVEVASATDEKQRSASRGGAAPEVLRLNAVSRLYRSVHGLTGVQDVSLTLNTAEVVGLVGGSGAGKTTLARVLAGLEPPGDGSVYFRGEDIRALVDKDRRQFRRAVQLIAQNPYSSIDPRYSARRAIEEPLRAFGIGDRRTRRARVRELADRVALPESILDNSPDMLSGGQCQRVAIARALATEPEVLICDEAVSALDNSSTRRVMDLLGELRDDLNLAIVFITHDLSAAAELTDRLVVMRDGRVIESGTTATVLTNPRDPYTRALVAATPPPIVILDHTQENNP
ncbi:ABC transporter ATP-binding protein [Rhodococcoides yunnanense]|uniref:ABC transporter ATP-binding protein n=1 Tax=Rhodococcoides yunnanense TaxID=278209 RepID=UPI0014742903|nr:ABC transporter ATP-binding protein [Rhodococcus yunnanensis]